MSDKEARMLAVQQAHFVMYDTILFLDTHPENEEALTYYRAAKANYEKAAEDYECKYGPLNIYSANGAQQWNWVAQPWPWEAEC